MAFVGSVGCGWVKGGSVTCDRRRVWMGAALTGASDAPNLLNGVAGVVMATRKKRKRQKKRMRRPAYQLEKSLLKLQHMFEEGEIFTAYAVFMYLKTRAHTPDIDTYKGILDGFEELGTAGDVKLVLDEMHLRQVQVDQEAMTIYLRALGRRKELDAMMNVYDGMKRTYGKLEPEVFKHLMRAFVAAGDLDGAQWTSDEMVQNGTRRSADFFEVQMHLSYLRSDPDAVDHRFFQMIDVYGFEPSDTAVRLRVRAYAEAGWLLCMEDAFDEMADYFVPYDAESYAYVVGAYVRAGDMDAARHHYDRMKLEGTAPTESMLQVLFDGFVAEENIGGMELVAADMLTHRVGPSEHICDGLIHHYAVIGSAEFLHRALMRKVRLDLHVSAVNFRELWRFCGVDAGQETALGLVKALRAAFPWESSAVHWSLALDSLLIHGRVREAVLCLKLMERKQLPPNQFLFDRVIRHLCDADRPEAAVQVVDFLEKRTYSRSHRTFEPLVRSFTKLGDVEAFAYVFGRMLDLDVMPRYRTKLWIYEHDWREPAVIASLATAAGHRIPFDDPAAVDELAQPLQRRPLVRRVRKARRGRENPMEQHGLNIDRIVEDAVDPAGFVGSTVEVYELLCSALVPAEGRHVVGIQAVRNEGLLALDWP